MKDKLVGALDFPRDYTKTGQGLRHCAHGGHYNKNDKICALCDHVEECLWLAQNDEYAAPPEKEDALLKSLLFPLDYIDLQLARAGHNIGICSCEACSWVRNTEELLNAFHRA